MSLLAHDIQLGPLDNHYYVLVDSSTREAAVVDAGFEPDALAAFVQQQGLVVKWILGTHAHYDHAAGVRELQQLVGGVYALHRDEQPLLDSLTLQGSMFGFPPARAGTVGHWFADREIIPIGQESLEVILTPGHSPGHCAFRQDGHVWVGDVLFAGSVGRTDLPGGSFEILRRSVHARLFTLPDDTVCHPGHGPCTTIGEERVHNPFVGQAAGQP
ncbi:MAG: MBL fold metallo-hydrolase [Candidatus Eisenbacteria bacterium]